MYCKVVFDVPLDRYFDYAIPAELISRAVPGVRITAPFGRLLTTGLIVSISEDTTLSENVLIKEITTVLDEKPLFGSDLFPLARFMKETWGGAIGQILFSLVPPQAYFKLLPAGEFQAIHMTPPVVSESARPVLSYLQQGFQRVLLQSPSGEQLPILLPLLTEVLSNYGQALITLPDVLAAHNFALQLQKELPAASIVSWHSKMLLSQKKQIFSHISNGLPGIVVSARSGGLLPFKNLRLAIMLEEEHDSYKQEENKPYFHLRDMLAYRCRQHEALFLAVSDTPSLETLYEVQQGRCIPLTQPTKETSYPLQIQVTEKKGQYSAFFSDELYQQVQMNLSHKKPSLLILNRRGYANAYYCLNCGAYAKCKKCGAILAHEKDAGGSEYLGCKKCGHKESMEQTCPKCQNKVFKSRGGGTQKIVSEINRLWPTARVLRLDSDTLKKKDGQGYQVLQAVQQGKADIVVGTRLALEVANAEQVRLAAMLDADLELDTPDFRASERFGQLLFKLKNKLANRPDGHLLIQASSADIYPFESLYVGYDSCAKEELLARESFAYPPYVKLVKVLIKSKDPVLLEAETARIMSAAAAYSTEALGPVKTGKKTDVLKKQYVLFKTTAQQYPDLLKLLDCLKAGKKTDIKLFADPYDFY